MLPVHPSAGCLNQTARQRDRQQYPQGHRVNRTGNGASTGIVPSPSVGHYRKRGRAVEFTVPYGGQVPTVIVADECPSLVDGHDR